MGYETGVISERYTDKVIIIAEPPSLVDFDSSTIKNEASKRGLKVYELGIASNRCYTIYLPMHTFWSPFRKLELLSIDIDVPHSGRVENLRLHLREIDPKIMQKHADIDTLIKGLVASLERHYSTAQPCP